MKYFFKIFLSIIFIVTFFTNSNASKNQILFKVNNEIITSVDILNEIKYLEIINSDFSNLEKQKAFEIAKKSLVREKIKHTQIKKTFENLILDEELLNQFIFNFFSRYKIDSKMDFEKFFLDKKIDPDLVRKKITNEVLWNQLIYRKYKPKVKIDMNKIKKELKKKNVEKEYNLEEILFILEKNENLDDKFSIIKKDIEERGFSKAALDFSISNSSNQGGALGWIKENFLSKKIIDELNRTKINEYTKPIVIPGGFLILNIKNIRTVKKEVDLDKQLKLVIDKKTNEQLNQFSNIFYQKIKQDMIINEY